jgi:hypothetical protein
MSAFHQKDQLTPAHHVNRRSLDRKKLPDNRKSWSAIAANGYHPM